MASEQCLKNHRFQLSYKDVQTLIELSKEAESEFNEECKKKVKGCWNQVTVKGAMRNLTDGDLILHASKTWGHGEFFKPPPEVLEGRMSRFSKNKNNNPHQNHPNHYPIGVFVDSSPNIPCPVKFTVGGAVVYKGKNHAGTECGWLWAWSDTNELNKEGIQVYAECGPICHFNNIDWDKVRSNVEKHGPYLGCEEGFTRTQVKSMIQDEPQDLTPTFGIGFNDIAVATFSG